MCCDTLDRRKWGRDVDGKGNIGSEARRDVD